MAESAQDPPRPPEEAGWAHAAFVTAPRALMAVLMLTAIAVNIANVFSRYVFNFALYWGEEVMIYVTIWFVMLGMAVAAYRGSHLNMDLLSARLPSGARGALNAVIALAFIGLCGFVAAQSVRVLALLARSGQVSMAAGVPMVLPHAALPVGFALSALAVAVRFRFYVTRRG